jgi:hypothetical protein
VIATCPHTGHQFEVDAAKAQETHVAGGVTYLWLDCPCCAADGTGRREDVPPQWWVFIVRPNGRLVAIPEEVAL